MENQVRPKKSPFASASMFLGIFAMLSLGTIFLPLPLAALGILFACLAHRKGQKHEIPGLVGLIASLVAIVISISVIVTSVAMIPTLIKDPKYRDQMDMVAEQIYGESFDDMIEDLYGIDIDDLFED